MVARYLTLVTLDRISVGTDEYGEPVAGPPVIPLEQIAIRIEGDTVIVGEEV